MDWQMRPRRAPGVELQPVVDGFIVYQTQRDRLHYLNSTAALLLEICDGELRAAELPELLAGVFQLAEPPRSEVEDCLEKLLAEGLLVPT